MGFLNTLDVEDDTDVLDDLARWRDWVRSTLALDPAVESIATRDSTRELRTHLRSLVSGGHPSHPLSIPVTVDLDAGGVRLTSETAAGAIAAAVAHLAAEQRWDRVKICAADDCRWAFYDASRNQSRQWCSMRVCGNRAKVRKHRDRAN